MTDFGDFACVVCGTKGNWKNVDEFRFKASGMNLCMTCGFVTYPKICMKTDDLTNHYRHDYREAPTVNNLFSGERKLHYHGQFLAPLFEEWKAKGKKKPKIVEIGAAFGMAMKWFNNFVPDAELYGTELTLSFRREAYWMYGFNLTEQPDFTKKYDLIMSYKVAEHIPGVDKDLRQYAEALTEDGLLYISVPTWFTELTNFGFNGFDLETYYDTNHVNVWSRNLFEQLLKKSGLKVVRDNHTFYGNTYLCVRDDSLMQEALTFDDPQKRLDDLKKVFEVGKLAMQGRFEEALTIWPNYPEAHINRYEMARSKLHQLGYEQIQKQFLDHAIACCPNSAHVANFAADLSLRYEKFDKAVTYFQKSLDMKPNDPQTLTGLGHCFIQMSEKAPDLSDKLKLKQEARQVFAFLDKTSKQCSNDAITWIMQINAGLPMPTEGSPTTMTAQKENPASTAS